MTITNENVEYWRGEAKRLKDSYYNIKQTCNHTSDTIEISIRWKKAKDAWAKSHEITKAIKEFEKLTRS